MKKILLVIEREYITRVKKKSFIITTILMPILFAALMVLPGLLSNVKSDKAKKIVVLDDSQLFATNLKSFGSVNFENAYESIDILKGHLKASDNYAVLYIEQKSDNPLDNISLYSENPVSLDVVNGIKMQITMLSAQMKLEEYNVENIEELVAALHPQFDIKTIRLDESGAEKESNTGALMGIAMISGILIFFVVFFFGIQVMRGVIEEKSSRIIEIIISSIKPFQLMMGKIVGVALVVLTQIIIWAVFITAIFVIFKSQFADIVDTIPQYIQNVPFAEILCIFVIYLILGYLLYSALFAAIGSAVDNETDTQQLQMIATIPLLIGYMMMLNISMQPDSPLAFWGSMIPFTSPLVMMARIPFGVPLWELILSISILIASFILLTWIAARIYRVGILMYGKKASLKEMIKWIRYKH